MKSSLQAGVSAAFTITVTDEMRPAFDGKVVRDVLSTVSMIYFMEKVGRDVLLPHLDEDEEGAGFHIDVKHIAPAVVGQEVTFRAVCTSVTPKRVACEVSAEADGNLVGKGTFTQAIFNAQQGAERIARLSAKN